MLFLSTSGFTTLKRVARLTAVVALVSACSSNDDGDTTNAAADNTNATQLAFVATGSYPTGQIERVNLSSDYAVDATYPATGDDILVETDGQNIYQVGRFQIDSVTRFSATDTSIVDYQFSVNDPDQSGANPSDIIFVNETKAYLLRYGSPVMWIINPSATTEEDFKIGEIDLSAYDTVDGDDDLDFAPEADSAVIVDDKLFILMQRMTGTLFFPIEKGYVAVVDTTTDTEIDTFTDVTGGLKGIPLDTLNPTNIRYNETTDEIYVTGRGNLYVDFNMLPDDPYQGGLF